MLHKTSDVPLSLGHNEPLGELGPFFLSRNRIKSVHVVNLAVENGIKGIRFTDLISELSCHKKKAQRKLKILHSKGCTNINGRVIVNPSFHCFNNN
jgi:hypothetical protein